MGVEMVGGDRVVGVVLKLSNKFSVLQRQVCYSHLFHTMSHLLGLFHPVFAMILSLYLSLASLTVFRQPCVPHLPLPRKFDLLNRWITVYCLSATLVGWYNAVQT